MDIVSLKSKMPVIRHVPGFKKIRRIVNGFCKDSWLQYVMRRRPDRYADYLYEGAFGYRIDWQHPRDLNEWINYLAFKTDTSEWSRLADKFEVRNFVSERGLSHILLPLYGKWENPSDIDFDALPNSFAIKTNSGCGDTILVADKTKSSPSEIRQKLWLALANRDEIFRMSAELHYLAINQLVVCEQLIPPPYVVDYKIWCFHGEPFGILTCSNRDKQTHHLDLAMYDLEWIRHDEWMTNDYKNDVEVEKPKHFDKMLEYAKILSSGFPEVRVDFYDTPEQVYFGEMTFTSCCGRMPYYTSEILKIMGEKIELGFDNNQ